MQNKIELNKKNQLHYQKIIKSDKISEIEELKKQKLDLEIFFLENKKNEEKKWNFYKLGINLALISVIIGSVTFLLNSVIIPLSKIEDIRNKLELARKEKNLVMMQDSLELMQLDLDKLKVDIDNREFALEKERMMRLSFKDTIDEINLQKINLLGDVKKLKKDKTELSSKFIGKNQKVIDLTNEILSLENKVIKLDKEKKEYQNKLDSSYVFSNMTLMDYKNIIEEELEKLDNSFSVENYVIPSSYFLDNSFMHTKSYLRLNKAIVKKEPAQLILKNLLKKHKFLRISNRINNRYNFKALGIDEFSSSIDYVVVDRILGLEKFSKFDMTLDFYFKKNVNSDTYTVNLTGGKIMENKYYKFQSDRSR